MVTKSKLIAEVQNCLVLAVPLAGAQLAQTATGFVDTLMMGMLGSQVIAAGGLGAITFTAILTLTSAALAAVSPLVATAYGAGDDKMVGRIVRQGLWLALILAMPLTIVVGNSGGLLRLLGQQHQTIALTETFLRAIAWGYFPGLGFAVLRSFVAALSQPRPIIVIVILGTLLNITGNYLLMFGKLGLPALGLAGIGWASAVSLWSMFLMLTGYILVQPKLSAYGIFQQLHRLDGKILRELVQVGLPIGGLVGVEVGLFAVTTFLVGGLGIVPLAAHQIALQSAAITFNVPLGIAFATTVRVGQLVGQGDRSSTRLAGLVGIGISGAFMSAMGLLFWLFPTQVVALYLDVNNPANAAVVDQAKMLLRVAAIFQLVDGIQAVAAGALRGLKDTRIPMLIGIFAYWGIGLSSGYILGLRLEFGGVGLWWGLAIGLTIAAIILTWRFAQFSASNLKPLANPS